MSNCTIENITKDIIEGLKDVKVDSNVLFTMVKQEMAKQGKLPTKTKIDSGDILEKLGEAGIERRLDEMGESKSATKAKSTRKEQVPKTVQGVEVAKEGEQIGDDDITKADKFNFTIEDGYLVSKDSELVSTSNIKVKRRNKGTPLSKNKTREERALYSAIRGILVEALNSDTSLESIEKTFGNKGLDVKDVPKDVVDLLARHKAHHKDLHELRIKDHNTVEDINKIIKEAHNIEKQREVLLNKYIDLETFTVVRNYTEAPVVYMPLSKVKGLTYDVQKNGQGTNAPWYTRDDYDKQLTEWANKIYDKDGKLDIWDSPKKAYNILMGVKTLDPISGKEEPEMLGTYKDKLVTVAGWKALHKQVEEEKPGYGKRIVKKYGKEKALEIIDGWMKSAKQTKTHELLHAVTVDWLDNNMDHPLNKELKDLVNYVKREVKANPGKYKALESNTYWTDNSRESIAELASRPEMFKELNEIGYKNTGKTVAQKVMEVFTEILGKVFGVEVKPETAASELVRIMSDVVQKGIDTEYQPGKRPYKADTKQEDVTMQDTKKELDERAELIDMIPDEDCK